MVGSIVGEANSVGLGDGSLATFTCSHFGNSAAPRAVEITTTRKITKRNILQALLGQKSVVPNNTSAISTVMLSKVDGMAIHVHTQSSESFSMNLKP